MRENVLLAREKRLKHVKSFFNLYPNDSLILIKANIPGPNKNYPFVNYLIKHFLNTLVNAYDFFQVEFYESFDGPYFICGIKGKSEKVKRNLIQIEETHPLGRFIDLDYFITYNKSLSRIDLDLPLRKCILCDKEAIICIKTKAHSQEEILRYIEKTTVFYFAEIVVDLVDYSIIRELKIDQKFGLVSFSSTGSHDDMNYQIMIKAKDAILYYFKRMFLAGYQATNLTTLLNSVRSEGIEAEKRMFLATGGINAYKGVIFLLGLTALSFGYTFKTSTNFDNLFKNIKIISANIFDDFETDYDSFGVKLYASYGIPGIRGVALSGLKIIKDNLNKITITSSDKELRRLLHYYILNTDDTVFIKRSKTYQNYLNFKEIISHYNPDDKEDLISLNRFAEIFKLSFGGAADLLITTIFIINLKELFII